jgi:hypothetical protein
MNFPGFAVFSFEEQRGQEKARGKIREAEARRSAETFRFWIASSKPGTIALFPKLAMSYYTRKIRGTKTALLFHHPA